MHGYVSHPEVTLVIDGQSMRQVETTMSKEKEIHTKMKNNNHISCDIISN